MPKILEDVREASRNDASNGAPIREILDDINANLREAEAKIYHRLIVIAILAGFFEITRQTSVDEISLFGVTIKYVDVVRIIIPPVVAYMSNSIVCIISLRRLLQEAYHGAFASLYPNLAEIKATHFTLPVDTVLLLKMIARPATGFRRTLYTALGALTIAVVLFFPPIFVVYSLTQCITLSGLGPETIVAVMVSLAFLVQIPFLISGTMRLAELKAASPSGTPEKVAGG